MKTPLMTIAASALLLVSTGAVAQESKSGGPGTAQSQEQKVAKGRILDVKEDHLVLSLDGAATEFYVHHDTTIEGKRVASTSPIHFQLTREYKPGDDVNVTYELRKSRNEAVAITKKR